MWTQSSLRRKAALLARVNAEKPDYFFQFFRRGVGFPFFVCAEEVVFGFVFEQMSQPLFRFLHSYRFFPIDMSRVEPYRFLRHCVCGGQS